MKAVRITRPGGPEVLQVEEVAAPEPGPSELLVAVRASALNRADLLQTAGHYPAPPDVAQDIPGLEYAGEVVAVGPRVRRFRVGDRVMGLVGGGAFAEQLVTHEREALPIPPDLDFARAAAVPEAFITAFDALVQAGLRPSEHVLIHAVTSGVGSAGVQLAKAFGANVIGTGRSAEKLARCKAELGLAGSVRVESKPPAFAQEVRTLTGGHGVDVVLDLVGGAYLPETLSAAATQARIVLVGLLAGRAEKLDLSVLLSKRLRLFGTVLRSRPIEEKIALARDFERQVLPLFSEGRIKPVVDAFFPMYQIQQACERMAQNVPLGKVVLTWQ
ncbi:MAG TPA: NAD(P)H-quinone oxidoreductase [Myxococcaceae bacterium]|nr:NAD(P)H-quinone oxidoreductase [Myxococcaceae bacterium]